MGGILISTEALNKSYLSFPHRQEPSQINKLNSRLRGDDDLISVSLSFTQINLLQPLSIQGSFDALFCRNTMIYWDKPTRHMILKKFAPLLRENALLYTGHAENLLHSTDLFHSLGHAVYE